MNKNKKKAKIFKKINFQKGFSKAKEVFFEKMNLPDEITYDLTKIENKEIYIEGKNKIVDYYDNYIKIQTSDLYIIVVGTYLEISDISDVDVLISGTIVSVEYVKR